MTERDRKIFSILDGYYPERISFLPVESPFRFLVTVMLSASTTDRQAEAAAAALFSVYPDEKAVADAPTEEIERLIRKAGLSKSKSKNIKGTAGIIASSGIPDTMEGLTALPGVGEKTATKLLLEYGTAENAYAHVEEIKPKKAQNAFLEHYDLAVLSRKLATINTDSPVDLDREKAKVHDFYTQEAYEFFKELEFKNFLSRFQDKGEQIKAEEYFQTVTDLALAEEIFKKAEEKEGIGLELLEEGGAAVLNADIEVYNQLKENCLRCGKRVISSITIGAGLWEEPIHETSDPI